MLNPERAAEQLKAVEIEHADKRQLERIAAMAEPLRVIAYGLLGRKEDGKEAGSGKWWKYRQDAAEKLDTLNAEQRQALFEVFFPTLAKEVELGWQLFSRLPYQTGAARRAFRAPSDPSLNREARRDWISSLLHTTQKYDQDVVWYAAWAPYIGWGAETLGFLFAAAIDAGGQQGEAVYDTLIASAKGEHEIGAMGRHVTRGLLTASRPDGWEFMEKFLLAAQRQEGLRQTILETVDEAHPEAFQRMLHLILDNELLRFSATLRAMDVWFGFGYDVETLTLKTGNSLLAQIVQFLENREAREQAIASGGAQTLYLALCASAYEDAPATVTAAARLLADASVERRFVAVQILGELHLEAARIAVLPALEDEDLRVAWSAFLVIQSGANQYSYYSQSMNEETIEGLFEALEKFIAHLPAKDKELENIVWPWVKQTTSLQTVAAALLRCLGDRSPKRLISHLPQMESYARGQVAELLAKEKKSDPEIRKTLFSMVGDTQEFVRDKAIAAIQKVEIESEEAQGLEKLLSRKAGTLRRSVLTLLLKQKDVQALASAERLLSVSNAPTRQAGLEMLQQMIKEDRQPQECRASAERYRARRSKPEETEEKLLEALLDESRETPTLDNGLGLFNPADCSPVITPRKPETIMAARKPKGLLQTIVSAFTGPDYGLVTETPLALMKSLDKLIKQNKEMPVTFSGWDGQKHEALLGDMTYLPPPTANKSVEEDRQSLPVRELWEGWWNGRSEAERDPDGFELLRLLASMYAQQHSYYGGEKQNKGWLDDAVKRLFAPLPKEMILWNLIQGVPAWLLRLHPPQGMFDFLLDAVEITLGLIPEEELLRVPDANAWWDRQGWRGNSRLLGWLTLLNQQKSFSPAEWTEAHDRRFWQLLHWMDKPTPGAQRHRPGLPVLLKAYQLGEANKSDLYDQLIGPRSAATQYHTQEFMELRSLTSRKPSPLLKETPELREVVDHCRERIIEIELHRGDMPTAASAAAVSLRSIGGLDALAKVLAVYGSKEPFVRSGASSLLTRQSVFSHLIRSTFPTENDTFGDFAERMQAIKATPTRLVELAVYAPQWAKYVEQALGWPELEEGVWWIHAHTKDQGWSVDQEIREEWNAQSAERTPLSSESLLEGAVDVAWFHRVYGTLGAERWKILDSAAKFASGGGGHKRAQLFADAMLGRLTEEELAARIKEKRNGDAVRALGLLPLPEDFDACRKTLLRRYKAIQEFLRTSKQFGAQRQESEKKAAGIGLENLARTAGYADPNRLQWAMEAEAVADLAKGPVTAQVGDVAVTLSINFLGKPELTVTKSGKPLKSLPPAVKKDASVAELQERKKDIERQGSRMRLSLENAMCRGDVFTGAELVELVAHPVLAPMLRSLVFVGAEDKALMGYSVEGGRTLEKHDGQCLPLASSTTLRIAHPMDIMQTDEWHLWQRDCFLRERVQPFKQVYRELYVLTEAEQKENKYSVRYEGHQVMPRQAMALAGSRGWVHSYEEGLRRTFHAENVTAWLTFDQYFSTPAEVEGLTVQQVYFTKRGEWQPLDLSEVPPRVFSEAMRDVDLIVSVAHAGGVDPEASASTVEMRETLLRETCGWLKISNVRFQSAHVLIDGKLGTYTVHMGSAVVHRQPGGHLCIVPVHSQHRGRLFLPFADDDPKTAEVISKVLLLAKDTEIKDPIILEQILPRG